jgi:HSP20 family protein
MTRSVLFLSSPADQQGKTCWTPPVDIFRARDGWLLRFELAGVRLEDVELRVSRREITLTGLRRDYMLEEGCSFYSMEISYNRFERVIELPDDLDGARVSLDYRDGLLLVRIVSVAAGHARPGKENK